MNLHLLVVIINYKHKLEVALLEDKAPATHEKMAALLRVSDRQAVGEALFVVLLGIRHERGLQQSPLALPFPASLPSLHAPKWEHATENVEWETCLMHATSASDLRTHGHVFPPSLPSILLGQ